jgi:hypothetical protein
LLHAKSLDTVAVHAAVLQALKDVKDIFPAASVTQNLPFSTDQAGVHASELEGQRCRILREIDREKEYVNVQLKEERLRTERDLQERARQMQVDLERQHQEQRSQLEAEQRQTHEKLLQAQLNIDRQQEEQRRLLDETKRQMELSLRSFNAADVMSGLMYSFASQAQSHHDPQHRPQHQLMQPLHSRSFPSGLSPSQAFEHPVMILPLEGLTSPQTELHAQENVMLCTNESFKCNSLGHSTPSTLLAVGGDDSGPTPAMADSHTFALQENECSRSWISSTARDKPSLLHEVLKQRPDERATQLPVQANLGKGDSTTSAQAEDASANSDVVLGQQDVRQDIQWASIQNSTQQSLPPLEHGTRSTLATETKPISDLPSGREDGDRIGMEQEDREDGSHMQQENALIVSAVSRRDELESEAEDDGEMGPAQHEEESREGLRSLLAEEAHMRHHKQQAEDGMRGKDELETEGIPQEGERIRQQEQNAVRGMTATRDVKEASQRKMEAEEAEETARRQKQADALVTERRLKQEIADSTRRVEIHEREHEEEEAKEAAKREAARKQQQRDEDAAALQAAR